MGLFVLWEVCSRRWHLLEQRAQALRALCFPLSERYSSEGGPLARVTSWALLLPALLLLQQFELQVEQQVAPPLPREVGPGRPKACCTPAVLWGIWPWWADSGQPRPTRPSLRPVIQGLGLRVPLV